MLKLTTYKAPEINDSLWKDFNAFTNKLNSTDKSLEKFKEEMIEFACIRENFSFSFVTEDDQIIAVIHLRGWNPKELQVSINSELKSCSNEMIELISELVKNYDDVSVDLVGSPTNDIGKDFFKKIGAKLIYSKEAYYLQKEKIDLVKMDDICESKSDLKKDLDLYIYDTVEDEVSDEHLQAWLDIAHVIAEEIVETYTNDKVEKLSLDYIKKSNLKKREKNISMYNAMLFSKDGKVKAYSMVAIVRNEIPYIRQHVTGVAKEYRNKGIALWLKAEMIKKLYNDFPTMTKIVTSTSSRNVGMNKINKKLGYEHSHSEDDYRIKIEEL
ncbi:MAG: hypothetical protein PF638_15835 [Candidatus Delongbacteria bacterium]|jgi:hypothetical protein|nr:hypothetical protein [Candidatus Delongbacteria bacterium]